MKHIIKAVELNTKGNTITQIPENHEFLVVKFKSYKIWLYYLDKGGDNIDAKFTMKRSRDKVPATGVKFIGECNDYFIFQDFNL